MTDRAGTKALARRTAVVLGMVTLFLLAWLLVREAFSFILLVFAGVLLGVFLDGATRLVADRLPLPRMGALAIVVVVLVGLLALVVTLFGPDLARQFVELVDRLPGAVSELRTWLGERAWGREVLEQVRSTGETGGEGSAGGMDLFGRLTGLFSTTFGAVTDVLIVTFLGVYFAVSPDRYLGPAVRLLPPERRSRGRQVFGALGGALRSWLGGRLASMAVVGVLTAVGLVALGVPLAFGLAILAGLLSFVPFLGPLVAGVPAVLVAFLESPGLALWVVALYSAVQFVESYLVTPLIQLRAVSLPPSALLAAQIVMGIAAGLLGVLLATPIAVVVVVLVQLLYIREVLGEEVAVAGS